MHGRFDFVHCHGVLYHEPDPIGMLQRLRAMLADGGEVLFGSMLHASAETVSSTSASFRTRTRETAPGGSSRGAGDALDARGHGLRGGRADADRGPARRVPTLNALLPRVQPTNPRRG